MDKNSQMYFIHNHLILIRCLEFCFHWYISYSLGILSLPLREQRSRKMKIILFLTMDLHETLKQIDAIEEPTITNVMYNFTTYSLLEPIPKNRTGKDLEQEASACDPI